MRDEFKPVDLDRFKSLDFALIYVATGGSESAFMSDYDSLTAKPVYILTSGDSNSLAASMEILSYLKADNKSGEILHGKAETIANRIAALSKAVYAAKKLSGMSAGIIGKPSDWLISSSYDKEAIINKLGVKLIDIQMEEFLEEISKAEFPSNEWTEKLLGMEFDKAEIKNALYVYGALHRLTEKYHLGALTVRCFALLDTVKTTGCLGLAILNAMGIYSGCEGDVPSLISMCVMGAVTGKPVFMCNPSRIDLDKGEMVLAHCTLPVNMPYEMCLATHFESDIGVAIAGSVPEGDCTIFKTSGDLSRHYINTGKLKANLREPTLCRTQLKLELPDYDYFLKNPINNHHLVCTGNESASLNAFFELLSIT
jgi:L-fucose isomerase-like protein